MIMESKSLQNIIDSIPHRYPKGSERIGIKEAREIINEFASKLNKSLPPREIEPFYDKLRVILKKSESKSGLKAGEMFSRLVDLAGQVRTTGAAADSDNTVSRLERQIRELRGMVSSKSGVEDRIDELQDQVESLRQENKATSFGSVEKHEDMLQKISPSGQKSIHNNAIS
jgi:hypothetical protein